MKEHPLVLLIDDEDNFLEIASMKLQGGGFEVVLAHSVPEAIEKAEELQPDLILSDIYMTPGQNGWQFALAVRRDPKISNIKFAFFTSLRDPLAELSPNDRATAVKELGNVPIFSKIDDVNDLNARARALLI